MSSKNNIIRCSFCKAEFNRWRTGSDGTKRHGYLALRDHCIREHPTEPAVQELILMEERELEIYGNL